MTRRELAAVLMACAVAVALAIGFGLQVQDAYKRTHGTGYEQVTR